MLKKHSNELLTILKKSGLDLTLFEAKNETIEKDKYFIIQLRETQIRFAVRSSHGDFYEFFHFSSTFEPNFPLRGQYNDPSPKSLYGAFEGWLNNVVKPYLEEFSTPDAWQTLEDSFSDTTRGIGTPDEFEPFSDEEKIQLKRSIDELRRLIETNFEVQKKELATTNKLLDHLSDAVDKHNKFDWRGIAINVAFNIATNLALNPELRRQLFDLFQAAFSNITHLLP